MTSKLDPVRFRAAAARFRAFFRELDHAFAERSDVLTQIALGLLCKEHVLLSGPPGTAKSGLASAVFGRILCEKTGQPSVYARQITESTVQTDLIGPVDFKTLMETGRTEHFTDEGILGATHAFLDEVFDGRDMLLRAALNVLQERELKQGSRITRGRIECAVLTSNRYVAEVLEQSRETLLAFVDRIAFVGFVPRGFASPESLNKVLRREVGRGASTSLDALLSLQDLDILQAAVDAVHVSPAACDALATLLTTYDAELAAATRADPAFLPTRYLSTRTAVRAGRVLRAACVHDVAMNDRARPLEVQRDDFALLRLHLGLAGPKVEEAEALLARETNPREKRQLLILQTEHQIIARCVAKVPPLPPSRAPSPLADEQPAQPPRAAAPPASAGKETEEPAPGDDDSGAVDPRVVHGEALRSGALPRITAVVGELVARAREGGPAGARAEAFLPEAVGALEHAALREVLAAEGDEASALVDAAERLAALALSIGDGSTALHSLSAWLRGRALGFLDDVVPYLPGIEPTALLGVDDASPLVDKRLGALERLARARRSLLVAGAEPPPAGHPSSAPRSEGWAAALDAAEIELGTLWDAVFAKAIVERLQPSAPLDEALRSVGAELDFLEALTGRMAALRGGASDLKRRAASGRLTRLVEALMRGLDGRDRAALHREIEAALDVLAKAGLAGAISAEQWIAWSAEALARGESARRAALDAAPRGPQGLEGYRKLRSSELRTPLSLLLCEVALRVDRPAPAAAGDPFARIRALAASLPAALRAGVVSLDLDRIERTVAHLEGWWRSLEEAGSTDMRSLVYSGIFAVLWGEAALARCSLEARLLADVFPDAGEGAQALRARSRRLQDAVAKGASSAARSVIDRVWTEMLAS